MHDFAKSPRMALSIRQPWAALIVMGRKSIEIRTWGTTFRGSVLIHAGKIPDRRAEAWEWVDSPELEALSGVMGGVIGEAVLSGCRLYRSLPVFESDRSLHLNEISWFQPPRMYGFEFRDARPIPFQPLKGQTLFFKVKGLANND